MGANAFALARERRFGNPELADLEADWHLWLVEHLPGYFSEEFGAHQGEAWDWAWSIELGVQPDPVALVNIWARGGAKSTFAEGACVAVGARRRRRYGLYVCDIQDRADDHVGNVESMISSPMVGVNYPMLAMRHFGLFGASKGWRRNRLRTAIGFTLDALGLDSAARGAKVDDARPDFIIFDDFDSETDTPAATERKIAQITKKILPTGSKDVAVIVVQNAVIRHGVISRLAGIAPEEMRADFLQNRKVIGPVPALEGFAYEMQKQTDGSKRAVITAGTPTWSGQDVEACQSQVDAWGITAFMSEAQHDVEAPPGGLWDHIEFTHLEWGRWPDLVETTVWVDPAVTNKDDSDSHGIQADALCSNGKIIRLFSWERRATPEESLELAISKAYELDATVVGVETDQGGDTWATVFRVAHQRVLKRRPELAVALKAGRKVRPRFVQVKAGEGYGSKVHRNQQMLADYEQGGVVHAIGTHQILERALKRFPKTKPFDLADVAFWSWNWLRHGRTGGRARDRRLRGSR